jgi:hypothetical protein
MTFVDLFEFCNRKASKCRSINSWTNHSIFRWFLPLHWLFLDLLCFVWHISFRLVILHFVSFRFVSFRFFIFHFVSFRFISFRFVLFSFLSLVVPPFWLFLPFYFYLGIIRTTGRYEGRNLSNIRFEIKYIILGVDPFALSYIWNDKNYNKFVAIL